MAAAAGVDTPNPQRYLQEEGEVLDADWSYVFVLVRLYEETSLARTIDEAIAPLSTLDVDGERRIHVGADSLLWDKMQAKRADWIKSGKVRKLGFADEEMGMHCCLAIYVYTLETPGIYRIVNKILHNPSRVTCGKVTANLKAVMTYVKFLTVALYSLPENLHVHGKPAWRGVPFTYPNLATSFHKGRTFLWYDFKSCSLLKRIAMNFLQDKQSKTLFRIQAAKGYRISDFSIYQDEEEVVFPPLTLLAVEMLPTEGTGRKPDEIYLVQKDILDARVIGTNPTLVVKAMEHSVQQAIQDAGQAGEELKKVLNICRPFFAEEQKKKPLVCVIGPTSAGKTTLLNALHGQLLAASNALPNTVIPVHYQRHASDKFIVRLQGVGLEDFLEGSVEQRFLDDLGKDLTRDGAFVCLSNLNSSLRRKLDQVTCISQLDGCEVEGWHATMSVPQEGGSQYGTNIILGDCPGGGEVVNAPSGTSAPLMEPNSAGYPKILHAADDSGYDSASSAGSTPSQIAADLCQGEATGTVIRRMLVQQMKEAVLVVVVVKVDNVSPLLKRKLVQALFGVEAPACWGILVVNGVDTEKTCQEVKAYFEEKRQIFENFKPLNLRPPLKRGDGDTINGFFASARTLLCEKLCQHVFNNAPAEDEADLSAILDELELSGKAEALSSLGFTDVASIRSANKSNFVEDACDEAGMKVKKANQLFEKCAQSSSPVWEMPEHREALEYVCTSMFTNIGSMGDVKTKLGDEVREMVQKRNADNFSDNTALDRFMNVFLEERWPQVMAVKLLQHFRCGLETRQGILQRKLDVACMKKEKALEAFVKVKVDLADRDKLQREIMDNLQRHAPERRIESAVEWMTRSVPQGSRKYKDNTEEKIYAMALENMDEEMYWELVRKLTKGITFYSRWRLESTLISFRSWAARETAKNIGVAEFPTAELNAATLPHVTASKSGQHAQRTQLHGDRAKDRATRRHRHQLAARYQKVIAGDGIAVGKFDWELFDVSHQCCDAFLLVGRQGRDLMLQKELANRVEKQIILWTELQENLEQRLLRVFASSTEVQTQLKPVQDMLAVVTEWISSYDE